MKKYINKYTITIFIIIWITISGITIKLIANDKTSENNKNISSEIKDNKKNNIDNKTNETNSETKNNNKNNIDNKNDETTKVNDDNNKVQENKNKDSSNKNENSSQVDQVNNKDNKDKTNNNNSAKDEDNNQNNSSNKDNNNQSSSSKDNESNDKTNISKNDDNKTNEEDNSKTEEKDINDEYRKSIENKYSIKIAYKDELGNYSINGYKYNKQYDDNVIKSHLQKIENALKKYPTNFFKEMKNSRMNLTIYIIKNFDNMTAGLTDGSNRSNVILTINTISFTSFEITLHHEIMHYIDSYITYNIGSGVTESKMKQYNPEGFNYGAKGNEYVYNYNNPNEAYFISTYGKTNFLEDRATIFADLMTSTSKKNYYSNGTPLYNKAMLISNQIKENFNCVTSSNKGYWEKYLK